MENNVKKDPKEIGNEDARCIKLAENRRAFVGTVLKIYVVKRRRVSWPTDRLSGPKGLLKVQRVTFR